LKIGSDFAKSSVQVVRCNASQDTLVSARVHNDERLKELTRYRHYII